MQLVVGEVSIPMGVESPDHVFDNWISTRFSEQLKWFCEPGRDFELKVEYHKSIEDYSILYRVVIDTDENTALLYRLTFGNKIV
jgi:hypothetical protein